MKIKILDFRPEARNTFKCQKVRNCSQTKVWGHVTGHRGHLESFQTPTLQILSTILDCRQSIKHLSLCSYKEIVFLIKECRSQIFLTNEFQMISLDTAQRLNSAHSTLSARGEETLASCCFLSSRGGGAQIMRDYLVERAGRQNPGPTG